MNISKIKKRKIYNINYINLVIFYIPDTSKLLKYFKLQGGSLEIKINKFNNIDKNNIKF